MDAALACALSVAVAAGGLAYAHATAPAHPRRRTSAHRGGGPELSVQGKAAKFARQTASETRIAARRGYQAATGTTPWMRRKRPTIAPVSETADEGTNDASWPASDVSGVLPTAQEISIEELSEHAAILHGGGDGDGEWLVSTTPISAGMRIVDAEVAESARRRRFAVIGWVSRKDAERLLQAQSQADHWLLHVSAEKGQDLQAVHSLISTIRSDQSGYPPQSITVVVTVGVHASLLQQSGEELTAAEAIAQEMLALEGSDTHVTICYRVSHATHQAQQTFLDQLVFPTSHALMSASYQHIPKAREESRQVCPRDVYLHTVTHNRRADRFMDFLSRKTNPFGYLPKWLGGTDGKSELSRNLDGCLEYDALQSGLGMVHAGDFAGYRAANVCLGSGHPPSFLTKKVMALQQLLAVNRRVSCTRALRSAFSPLTHTFGNVPLRLGAMVPGDQFVDVTGYMCALLNPFNPTSERGKDDQDKREPRNLRVMFDTDRFTFEESERHDNHCNSAEKYVPSGLEITPLHYRGRTFARDQDSSAGASFLFACIDIILVSAPLREALRSYTQKVVDEYSRPGDTAWSIVQAVRDSVDEQGVNDALARSISVMSFEIDGLSDRVIKNALVHSLITQMDFVTEDVQLSVGASDACVAIASAYDQYVACAGGWCGGSPGHTMYGLLAGLTGSRRSACLGTPATDTSAPYHAARFDMFKHSVHLVPNAQRVNSWQSGEARYLGGGLRSLFGLGGAKRKKRVMLAAKAREPVTHNMEDHQCMLYVRPRTSEAAAAINFSTDTDRRVLVLSAANLEGRSVSQWAGSDMVEWSISVYAKPRLTAAPVRPGWTLATTSSSPSQKGGADDQSVDYSLVYDDPDALFPDVVWNHSNADGVESEGIGDGDHQDDGEQSYAPTGETVDEMDGAEQPDEESVFAEGTESSQFSTDVDADSEGVIDYNDSPDGMEDAIVDMVESHFLLALLNGMSEQGSYDNVV